MKTLKANGANIPALGLGTYDLREDVCVDMVSRALNSGYRHVDTAAFYENEQAIGEGIRASGRAREDVFLTTKVWPTEVREGEFQRSVEDSLAKLKLAYVDLLLIHWPPKDGDVRGWAKLLNQAADRGWTKHIGVSNFTVPLLDGIVDASDRPIAVNQVENHPYLNQSKLRAACARHGAALIAYCPLYKAGDLFAESAVVSATKQHDKSPAQIVLRWHMQHDGAGAIPKTATPSRMEENIDIFDFELSDDEMTAISKICGANRRICDFEFSPTWDVA